MNTNSKETINNLEEKNPKAYTEYVGEVPPPIQINGYGDEVGQILFSKEFITYGEEDKSAITNTFKAGDEVFAMVYLSNSKINLGFERGYTVRVRDEEDGRGFVASQSYAGAFKQNEDGTSFGDDNFLDLDIFVSEENSAFKELTSNFLEILTIQLKSASTSLYEVNVNKVHKLKVEITAYGGNTVSEGIFYYDLTEGHEKIFEMYETHKQANLKEFKLPASKRDDPALAAKLEKIMVDEGVNVQKVVFTSDDWGYIRHEISGAVLRRTIFAFIIHKDNKDECYYNEVQFTEEFVGNDFTGIIQKAGYGPDHGKILLENIND